MAKKGSGARPRTARRALGRELTKEVRERERAVVLTVGGAPERPIEVETPAVIEPHARSTPCHQCGGELGVEEHAAEAGLRVVRTTCRRCHAPRTLWFRLVPRAVN